MPDYSKGKIYKIVCKSSDKVYVGSTTQTLEDRLKRHEAAYKSCSEDPKGFRSSFEILKEGDYEIVLIENFPASTKKELLFREKEVMKETAGVINSRLPVQDEDYDKRYREEHHEHRIQYNRQYRKDHVEEIKKYTESRKEERSVYLKEYREKNSETLRVLKAEYAKEKRQEPPTVCSCGGSYSYGGKSRHEKTKKHLESIQ